MSAVYNVSDFQHERDSKFASQIMSSAAAKQILNILHKTDLENVYTYIYRSSCPPLAPKTSPEIFDMLNRACDILGLDKVPEIYVTRNYDEMVDVRGINEPFIIFSSEYLRKLDGETLFGIIASRVAAIRCQHHIISYITWGLEFAASMIPVSYLVVESLINDWLRSRYFTYDKTFCLVTNNRALSLRQVLLNVVPADILAQIKIGTNADTFNAQARKFIETKNDDNTQAGIKKAISMFSQKDWLPERYEEVNRFFDERGI